MDDNTKIRLEEKKLAKLIRIEEMRRQLYAMRLSFKENFNDTKLNEFIEIVDEFGNSLPKADENELRDMIRKDYDSRRGDSNVVRYIYTKYMKSGYTKDKIRKEIKDYSDIARRGKKTIAPHEAKV